MRKSLLSFMLFLSCLAYASEKMIIDPAEGLILSNDFAIYEFEAKTMGLKKMIDRSTGYNHISEISGSHLLWEVAFGVGRQIYTITNNYQPCTNAFIQKMTGGGQRVVMEWNKLRWWNEDSVVSIIISVELPPDDGVAQWRISVDNNSDYWGLWAVLFPIINGFPSSGDYDIARPVFARGGLLLKNHNEKISGRYPGATWAMQYMSFNKNTNAVYLGTQDEHARAKDFVAEPVEGLQSQRFPVVFEGRRHKKYLDESGERIYITHYPDNMGVTGSDYSDYYPVEFGVYQGGWLEAAHRYRPWALKQKWIQKGALINREDVPQKIKETAVWIRDNWEWQGVSGTAEQMNKPLIHAAEQLQVPVGFHWYRWHHNLFDQDYPYFLPAKENFKERVEDLLAQGLLVTPYINGSSADMNITNFEEFEPHAVKDEAGGIRHHYYSNKSGRLLSMCGNQSLWQSTISELVEDIFNQYNVNGIYVDQVIGLYHELCFAEEHNHTIGGGNYWAEGNRKLMQDIKISAHKDNRDNVITSEGASEVFLDVVDANLLWSQPSEFEIPAMQVVYSGYTLFFGSPCDYTKSDRFFIYAQGRAFMDGRQNGWMDLGLFQPQHKNKVEFFRQCGLYRVAAKKFLTYGRLWGPLEADNDIPDFTEKNFGWGMYEKMRSATVPSAEARLWQSPEGSLGIIIVNYTTEKISFSYLVDPAKYGNKMDSYSVNELTPTGSVLLATGNGILKRSEMLNPSSIKVIEIVPEYK